MKKKDKKLISLVVILLILLLCCACSSILSLSDNTTEKERDTNKNNSQEEDYMAPTEEIIADEPAEDIVINTPEPQAPEDDRPFWQDKEFTVTTIVKFDDGGSFDTRQVNVWRSYTDRDKALFSLKDRDTVVIIDYDEEYDYCKVRKDGQEGWISCAWIVGLPEDMIDDWEL